MVGIGPAPGHRSGAIPAGTTQARLGLTCAWMRRLRARERIRQEHGGVDQQTLEAFYAWARRYDDLDFAGRSRVAHERWLAALDQPVLRLDSAAGPEELRSAVLSWEPST